MWRSIVSVRIGVSVEWCPFARGMRGPPVFCPKVSRPVVKLAHGVWTQDYPIDRGKKKHVLSLRMGIKKIASEMMHFS